MLRFNHTDLRRQIYPRMRVWGSAVTSPSRHLYWLLRGERNSFMVGDRLTDEEVRLVEMMLGDHGFTVYKMLLARRKAK